MDLVPERAFGSATAQSDLAGVDAKCQHGINHPAQLDRYTFEQCAYYVRPSMGEGQSEQRAAGTEIHMWRTTPVERRQQQQPFCTRRHRGRFLDQEIIWVPMGGTIVSNLSPSKLISEPSQDNSRCLRMSFHLPAAWINVGCHIQRSS